MMKPDVAIPRSVLAGVATCQLSQAKLMETIAVLLKPVSFVLAEELQKTAASIAKTGNTLRDLARSSLCCVKLRPARWRELHNAARRSSRVTRLNVSEEQLADVMFDNGTIEAQMAIYQRLRPRGVRPRKAAACDGTAAVPSRVIGKRIRRVLDSR